MATILDVAKLAGVSQGTVSNVLNRKGNVSSKKIKAVEDAAHELGFTINEKAKRLRKGFNNTLAAILPNIQFKQYRDFYTSLKVYAEKKGVSIQLFISHDSPDEELLLIQQAKSEMIDGIAVISCLDGACETYTQADFSKICFVERKPGFEADYFGFDYQAAGRELADTVKKYRYQNVALIHGKTKYSNEREFVEAFCEKAADGDCNVITVSTDIRRIPHSILNVLDSEIEFDAVVTTNFGFAEKIRQISNSLIQKDEIPIYTLSPFFSLPENDYKKYELNYNLLGRMVGEHLILTGTDKTDKQSYLLENDGYRKWHQVQLTKRGVRELNILTVEGPESTAIKALAKIYEETTGTGVNISLFPYEEIYEAFINSKEFGIFDVFRMDVTWLSWLAEKILLPLEEIDPGIAGVFPDYIPSMADKYCKVNGKIYALPVTPSAQMLFYRKDLFEDAAVKRLYHECYKTDLKIPADFDEFNQIAGFFTKSISGKTKTKYGTSLSLGNTGMAATEFLTRFFSFQQNLYSEQGTIIINHEAGLRAMNNLLEATRFIGTKAIPWWTDAAKAFADGDVAMSVMFSNYASEILGFRSKIIDKVGCCLVPGGNPIVGGGIMGVARNCSYPEDALALIKWLTRDPVASAMAALGSVSPCIKTYENYEIVDAFPWLELSKECFAISHTGRLAPTDTRPFDEKRFLSIIGGMVKNVYAGVVSPQRALDLAQATIDEYFN